MEVTLTRHSWKADGVRLTYVELLPADGSDEEDYVCSQAFEFMDQGEGFDWYRLYTVAEPHPEAVSLDEVLQEVPGEFLEWVEAQMRPVLREGRRLQLDLFYELEDRGVIERVLNYLPTGKRVYAREPALPPVN